MNTHIVDQKLWHSSSYPSMNRFLLVLEIIVKKLHPSHLDPGFIISFYNKHEKKLISEPIGHIPMGKDKKHIHESTIGVLELLINEKLIFSSDVRAINIDHHLASTSGYGKLYEQQNLCVAISALWIIVYDLYHHNSTHSKPISDEIFLQNFNSRAIFVSQNLIKYNSYFLKIVREIKILWYSVK